jgi:copper resistance protein B
MMRAFCVAMWMAVATPATAQHMDHSPSVQGASPPSHSTPVDPKCPPEHAAMGHCTPKQPATAPSLPDTGGHAECSPEHAAMGHCKPGDGNATPPPRKGPSAKAMGGPDYAADSVWGAEAMAPARHAAFAEHGSMRTGKVLIDRLELRAQKGRNGYAWEGEVWYGGDYDRLWIKSEGEGGFGESTEQAEVQALWSHALDPWINLQAGIRYDIRPRPDRAHMVIGVKGMAPFLLEIDAAAFLSDHGDPTVRAEVEYDQRITNRLILQPRGEINLAVQDVPSTGVGAGVSTIEAGLRLRYEIVPEFAPYLGVEYERSFGRTANYARAAGESAGGWKFLAGMRAWF